MKKKVIEIIKQELGENKFNWKPGVDYDYETDYPCDGGCKDDYCRCGVIRDITITLNFEELLKDCVDSLGKNKELNISLDDLNVYGIRKLFVLNSFDDESVFEGEATGGYYGQEMGDVTHPKFDLLVEDLRNFLSFHTKESKIKYLLAKEFDEIPEKYKDINFEELNVEDLMHEDEKKYFSSIVKNMKKKLKK